MNRRLAAALGRVAVLVLSLGCLMPLATAQDKKVTQEAGVDNTRMGAYRALAQLSYQSLLKGDNATAAELARVLERTWDQGEWHNLSENSYCKANRAVCQPIDQSMDVFIGPIMNYSKKTPEPPQVEAALNDFLQKLEKAE